jgi:hypothetical protein
MSPKTAGVTGMINRKSARKTNYLPARFSAVNDFFAVLNSAGMNRMNHGGLPLAYPLRAAFNIAHAF